MEGINYSGINLQSRVSYSNQLVSKSDVGSFIADNQSPDEGLNAVKFFKRDSRDGNFYFVLTNNIIGASFKDESMLLHDKDLKTFRFILETGSLGFKESRQPKVLKKKVRLLTEHKNLAMVSSKSEGPSNESNIHTIFPVSLLQMKHIMFFKFNNRAVQGYFSDSTILMLNVNGNKKKVLYWDKRLNEFCFETTILRESKEIARLSEELMDEIQAKIKYMNTKLLDLIKKKN